MYDPQAQIEIDRWISNQDSYIQAQTVSVCTLTAIEDRHCMDTFEPCQKYIKSLLWPCTTSTKLCKNFK